MEIAIEVSNLKKKLGPNQALRGISTNFEAGLMHGIIGPEGAGKTTLIRHLIGLLKANSGAITYLRDGRETSFSEIRYQMAYMPQQQSLYPDLSVEEHMDFFKELYGLSADDYAAKRERLLHITRLADFLDRPAAQLSGGMYKKLGLMCALLSSPKVLLLDEPTNGVDPISRREFWELLYQLQEQKILIIVTTAYMDEAERCSRVHLVQQGHLIGSGEPRALLQQKAVQSFDEYFLKHSVETIL